MKRDMTYASALIDIEDKETHETTIMKVRILRKEEGVNLEENR